MAEFFYERSFDSWIYTGPFSDEFQEFLTGYLEAGMFTCHNPYYGAEYMIENDSIMEAFSDCVRFMNNNRTELNWLASGEGIKTPWRRLGNLFLFSRNGEGTGFWDLESFDCITEYLQSAAMEFGEWSPELKEEYLDRN